MKQGWEIKKLGEICDFQGGSQPPKEEWIDEPREGYVRMLQIRDFTQSRSFDIEYVKESNRLKYCNEDDVLLGRYGASVGKVLTGLAGAYNVAIMKTMPNKDLLNKSYFKYFLESPSFQVFLQQACTMRAAQAGFSKEDVQDFTIPVPPREEQERIVEILDREFERIDALKANAEQNLQHAKDLFQSALKQELQPKEGWTVKHLEKISTFSQGVQVEIGKQSTEMQDGYMRFLRIVDFTKGNEPPRYVGITDEKYQVKYDSLSVVRYGASAGFICTGLEGVIANNIFRIVPKKDILIGNTYLYYVLISDIFQSVIRDSVNGAAMPAISFGMIKNIDIPYPSIDEQQSIVVRLDKLREHCKALEENYTKTIALCDDMKQALLRKAFNGEL